MNAFKRLPGFHRSPPGLEQRIWRRLPALLLWGTLVPLLLGAANHLIGDETPGTQMRDYALLGTVTLHWSLVLTLGLGCFIVRVMKGPAYVADGYTMPRPGIDDVRPAPGGAPR